MAAESDEPIEASSVEPLRWPDTSRPIINEQAPGYGAPHMPYPQVERSFQPRRWPAIAAVLVIVAMALIAVWLLWWQ